MKSLYYFCSMGFLEQSFSGLQKIQPVCPKKSNLVKIAPVGLGVYRVAVTTAFGTYSVNQSLASILVRPSGVVYFTSYVSFASFRAWFRSVIYFLVSGHYFEFIIRGIGFRYKFHRKGSVSSLSFRLGYSHRVLFQVIPHVEVFCNKRFDFFVFSFLRSTLTQYCEELRGIRQTDSYKGKGLKYYDAPLRLKVGKVR